MKKLIRIISLVLILSLLFAMPVQAKTKYTIYKAEKVTAKQVVKQLKKGIGIKKIRAFSKADLTFMGEPNGYRTKIKFTDKKYPKVYSTVEVFDDVDDAVSRHSYMQSLSYIYSIYNWKEDVPLQAIRYKNVIVRISDAAPRSYAKKYYKILKKIIR